MHRRQILIGCGCLTLGLAGCLDDESEDSGSYFAVARPYETVPPDGPTTTRPSASFWPKSLSKHSKRTAQ